MHRYATHTCICIYMSIIYISVHIFQIDADTYEREGATLSCSRFKGSHTFDKIAEALDTVRTTFGINENKLVATVTDNGSNFVRAFNEYGIQIREPIECLEEEQQQDYESDENERELNEDMNVMNEVLVPEDPAISDEIILSTHLRCCSHTLSLICTTDAGKSTTTASKLHHSTMGKCSALWNAAGRPKSAEIIMEHLQCQLKLPCGHVGIPYMIR